MVRWWKRFVYKGEVMPQLVAMTLMLGKQGKMLRRHVGVRDAIRTTLTMAPLRW